MIRVLPFLGRAGLTLALLLALIGPGAGRPAAARFTAARFIASVSASLVISQVYGGGGNSGAIYTHDFIELFNRGSTPVSLAGWSLQYSPRDGSFGSPALKIDLPPFTLQPGQFFLVQLAQGVGGTTPLPAPDYAANIPLHASSAAVALLNTTALLPVADCPALSAMVDLLGYGSFASCWEGAAPAPAGSNVLALTRADRCADSDNNAADFTAQPPDPRNSIAPLAPCPADALAPGVTQTVPAHGAVDVPVEAPVTVLFSEDVAAAEGWFEVACQGQPQALASAGGPRLFTLTPLAPLPGGADCTVTILPERITDLDGGSDPMPAAYSWSFQTALPCTADPTPIYAIQGDGPSGAFADGTPLTTQGVVTADFRSAGTGQPRLGGFFIQDAVGDGRVETSDGLFVALPGSNPLAQVSFAPGDLVEVSGAARELNGLTILEAVTGLKVCDTGAVLAPAPVSLPETFEGELEQYEGMMVTFPQELTVSGSEYLGRYGQLILASGGRMFHPNTGNGLGGSFFELQRRVIVLDDGSTGVNPNPLPYLGAENTRRVGDTVTGLTGVMDYGPISALTSLRDYRLHPAVPPVFTPANPRTGAPIPAPEGQTPGLVVAGFNVFNYFTTLNAAPYPEGSPYSTFSPPRGAVTALELERQQAKLVEALAAVRADVFGLMEIEAWDGANAPQTLVDALNARLGAPGLYAVVADPPTGVGGDLIQVTLIYQTARVAPLGAAIKGEGGVFERAPVAQLFTDLDSGERFVVVANHFKSKSCQGASGEELDLGQGCWNARRTRQAAALLEMIHNVLIPLDPDVLVIGDLNSLGMEDPIRALTAGGLVNLTAVHVPAAGQYSYVFEGLSGYIDHALATPSLAARVTGAAFWPINGDEPPVMDYHTGRPQDFYTVSPYRSSDHDPLLVGISWTAEPARFRVYLPALAGP